MLYHLSYRKGFDKDQGVICYILDVYCRFIAKKKLKFAHLNICSLRNKVHEVADLLLSNTTNIVALSETRLDETFDDNAVYKWI